MHLSSLSAIIWPRIARVAVLGLAVLCTALSHQYGGKLPPLQAIEFSFRDSIQQFFSRPIPASNVALIDIDEETLRYTTPWPWPRSQVARLVESALANGARLVVLDMVFPEPRDPIGDQRLLDLAMARQVVLSQVFDYANRTPENTGGVVAGALPDAVYKQLNLRSPTSAFGHIANHALFQNAPCVGNIGFTPDDDGKLRRLMLFTRWEDKIYPSLSLAAIACQDNELTPAIATELSNTLVLKMPRTDDSWLIIPAHELMQIKTSLANQGLFKNKIVIIGSSALGLSDRVATPLAASSSGMLVHAHAIEQLLNVKQTHPYPQWLVLFAGLALVAFIGIIFSLTSSLVPAVIGSVTAISLWVLFTSHQALAGSEAFLMSALPGLMVLGAFHLPTELSRARRDVRATVSLLSRYVAKPVLQQLLRAGNFDPLKLRHADITVVVVDMADYSKTIESLDLEASARLTRGYLECLTEPVWSTRGTLDRYTGDGLVAFWGAPIADKNQALHALHAVQLMQDNINHFNGNLVIKGLPKIYIRVGIASGAALVGDFGTRYRATYTAVGSCINLASRLESKAKELGVSIVANEEFSQGINFQNCSYLGAHQLRGIGEIAVYQITL